VRRTRRNALWIMLVALHEARGVAHDGDQRARLSDIAGSGRLPLEWRGIRHGVSRRALMRSSRREGVELQHVASREEGNFDKVTRKPAFVDFLHGTGATAPRSPFPEDAVGRGRDVGAHRRGYSPERHRRPHVERGFSQLELVAHVYRTSNDQPSSASGEPIGAGTVQGSERSVPLASATPTPGNEQVHGASTPPPEATLAIAAPGTGQAGGNTSWPTLATSTPRNAEGNAISELPVVRNSTLGAGQGDAMSTPPALATLPSGSDQANLAKSSPDGGQSNRTSEPTAVANSTLGNGAGKGSSMPLDVDISTPGNVQENVNSAPSTMSISTPAAQAAKSMKSTDATASTSDDENASRDASDEACVAACPPGATLVYKFREAAGKVDPDSKGKVRDDAFIEQLGKQGVSDGDCVVINQVLSCMGNEAACSDLMRSPTPPLMEVKTMCENSNAQGIMAQSLAYFVVGLINLDMLRLSILA